MYDPASVPLPRRAATPNAEAAQHPRIWPTRLKALAEIGNYSDTLPRSLLEIDERELRQLRATYYGMITQVDDQIGRLIGTSQEDRRIRPHAHHLHLRPRRDAGRSLAVGKPGYFDEAFHIPLIIRDLAWPPKTARGPRGGGVHRGGRPDADRPRLARPRAAGAAQRPLAAAVPSSAAHRRAGVARGALGIRLQQYRRPRRRKRLASTATNARSTSSAISAEIRAFHRAATTALLRSREGSGQFNNPRGRSGPPAARCWPMAGSCSPGGWNSNERSMTRAFAIRKRRVRTPADASLARNLATGRSR